MAIFAIGDIHGSYTALNTLLQRVSFSANDTLVFLGDYVDKGTNTQLTLDLLLEVQSQYNCRLLMGNHEIMMMDARLTREDFEKWQFFGGDKVLASYGIKSTDNWENKIPQAHWQLIEQALPYFEKDDFIFVHASLKPNVALELQTPNDLFWKKNLIPEPYSANKTVICGHTARKNGEIANFGHTICIDTYAHGGMWLTCLNVSTMAFFQANEKGFFKEGQLKLA